VTEGGQARPLLDRSVWNAGWIRSTLLIALTAGGITGAISFFLPKTYKAEAKLLPDFENQDGTLAGLAAASGLAGMLSQFGSVENPVLTYPEILSSRVLLERVLLSPYPLNTQTQGANVLRALGVHGSGPREATEDGARRLLELTSVRPNPRSGIITISAVSRDSVLSAYIVQRMLEELDRFNLESRESHGRAARIFVEGRVEDSRRELARAEEALATFHTANIRIGNSPQLRLEQSRLEREVETRTELYRLLARQYEMSRIEEKRNTPTFSVVDPPRPPVRKYQPRILLNILVAVASAIGLRFVAAYLPLLRGQIRE
jgi:uncharacterized protein involved in exopolysaccharide biosynthesis